MTEKSPRVVDFSTHFSGPTASRQLAQLGADVVKVEHPKIGDGNRHGRHGYHTRPDGTPTEMPILNSYLNAGTRSVAANPRDDSWNEMVAHFAQWADIVIVGNRPENAARIGIDFPTLLEYRSDLVYCQITGYGLDGPWADLPAHGLNMDVLAGSVPIEWHDGNPDPPASYRSVGTTLAGIQAALGSMFALHKRDRTGQAQYVHVSVWETALSWMWRDLTSDAAKGAAFTDYKDFGARYCTYRTADDHVILACPVEKRYWERFCDVLGLPEELRSKGDWSTGMDSRNYPGERAIVQEKVAQWKSDDLEAKLHEADVPFAPVLDWREAYASDQAEASGAYTVYQYRGDSIKIPTTPVSVTSIATDRQVDLGMLAESHRRKGKSLQAPSDLGADTQDVMVEIGMSGETR